MLLIREAAEADAPALLAIYRPLVESTAVSFEAVAPSQEEFAARIAKILKGWQWLVAERNGECAGYAYASSHRERGAYRWSVEVSAYVCRRRSNIDPPCRSNIDPGMDADRVMVGCGQV